tara:strand:+ start:72 stop:629 length:558 start_codon:yes stop_codon:yes gene_type:complete
MILVCQCGEKKFVVPDNAIPAAGRLVQCSYCGSKWTQFPLTKKVTRDPINISAKKEVIEKPIKVSTKIQKKEIFNVPVKKKKIIKKRSGPSIYSKEYLEKKHGISINALEKNKTKIKENKTIKSSLGFYSYFLIFIIFIIFSFGILNLSKENLVMNFPFLEIYVNYIYETLLNIRLIIKDLFSNY